MYTVRIFSSIMWQVANYVVLSVHFKHKQVTAVEYFHLLRVDDHLPRVGILANARFWILLSSSGTDIVAVIPSGSTLGNSYQTLFYKGPLFIIFVCQRVTSANQNFWSVRKECISVLIRYQHQTKNVSV